jgi:hypothetical protein
VSRVIKIEVSEPAWHEIHSNLVELGNWLVDAMDFDASDLMRFFEKPWKWEREFREMQAAKAAGIPAAQYVDHDRDEITLSYADAQLLVDLTEAEKKRLLAPLEQGALDMAELARQVCRVPQL